jgi:pimeloyl-ACP methyl ester carboxylesterase
VKIFNIAALTIGLSLTTLADTKSCLRTYSIFKVSSISISKSELKKAIQENRNIEGYYTTQMGRRIYFKFESGNKELPLSVLVHGLGDELQDMQGINNILNKDKGYRTLRVDTHLSGKTLENVLAETNSEVPPYFHYKKNTYDISELLRETGVKDMFLAGHSYGGGLVWDITSFTAKYFNNSLIKELKKQNINIRGIVQMSPYLQRADKYQAEKISNLTVVPDAMNSILGTLATFGLPMSFLEKISKPWEDLTMEVIDEIRQNLVLPKKMMELSLSQKNQDIIMDPFLDQFMTKNFTAYFVHKAKMMTQKSDLTAAEMNLINKKVAACIALTKGIRPFDILDRKNDLRWPENIPVLLIGGEKDALVSPVQLHDFTTRLTEMKIPFEFYVIPDGSHLFPQTHAKETAELINNFFEKVLNKAPLNQTKAI